MTIKKEEFVFLPMVTFKKIYKIIAFFYTYINSEKAK